MQIDSVDSFLRSVLKFYFILSNICITAPHLSVQRANRRRKIGLSKVSLKITDITLDPSMSVIGECYKAVMSRRNFAHLYSVSISILTYLFQIGYE